MRCGNARAQESLIARRDAEFRLPLERIRNFFSKNEEDLGIFRLSIRVHSILSTAGTLEEETP